ncbi:hypothetical protein [Vreelandella stevensii]|uniref:hypothetical protein n=1 Tax=Vreelandella stevensii TaxID=502821 RepID=UPI0002EBC0C4|nr:hypothetical protein [Halomonas stevensii]
MTMTVGELFIALVLIALVLLVSNALRLWLPWLRRLFLPRSWWGRPWPGASMWSG